MIIVNRKGLSEAQQKKVKQPYARNTGEPVNFKVAAKEAQSYLSENPTLLKEVGDLLNDSH